MNEMKSALAPLRLAVAHLDEAPGLNDEAPVFSWALGGTGGAQSAFRLVVALTAEDAASGHGTLYDSGRRETSFPGMSYDGPPLRSGLKLFWSVCVFDDAGHASGFCPPAFFFTGLRAEDWQADWIARYFVLPAGRDVPQGNRYDNRFQARPADYLRCAVQLAGTPVRATAYVTALGVYEFYINGARIGDHVLAPGWTDYHRRVEYQTYDVTGHFADGENVVGAILGEGWYSGRIGHNQRRAGNHYGGRPGFCCQIVLEFEGDRREVIVSNGDWQTVQGPILYSDFLAGEAYDARLEINGWAEAGFDTALWQPVEVFTPDPKAPQLDAQRAEPIRAVARLPAHHLHARDGMAIYDLKQNIAGYCALRLRAEAGSTFRLSFAERLKDDGTLYLDNMRYAVNEDIYIAKGADEECFTPRFTFRGFQYVGVRIEGPGELVGLEGVAIQTDTPVSGTISTGNPMVNQLISNIFWGQRDNFLAVPTDCPQRDERYGWTADAQVFWKTAGYFMDIDAFLKKWMEDLIDGQSPEGAFPDVAPTKPLNPYRLTPQPGAPGWGDGPIIMAWHHYLRYGDDTLLVRAYDNLAAWMDYIADANPDGIRRNRNNNNYGDWLNVGPKTDPFLVASAYWIHLADLMAGIADAIGRDALRWQALGTTLRAAFLEAYWVAPGRLSSDTQTAYLLALAFDVLPPRLKRFAAARLEQLFAAADWHLQTGFLGVRHVCPVVADFISEERAVDLLLKDSYPSWGFSIRHGATTIWERWDGWTPENGFQSPAMNSFNHYAYGAVGEWIWARLAGIDWLETAPGYRGVLMRPVFDRRIGHVEAVYAARTGAVKSAWKLSGDAGEWHVTLPPGVFAQVELPAGLDAVRCDGVVLTGRAFRLESGAHSISFSL
ncbi:alpha-L-rhamnosidase [Martelella sp. HB161492]|uniref:alpha-L-rhamnosidase n=1 Tax=Martelella sp. HB161492 TaxID=2720726 RepID=UPI0015900288|nr:alpha-L-rhamnosidase [Martelella sp. HB161492]